jgi:hypothetical protein
MNSLTSPPAEGDEGLVVASLRNTSEEDAGTIARRILELYLGLARLPRDQDWAPPS